MGTLEHIGYVAGVRYNNEWKTIDWLYGASKLCKHGEDPKILKTRAEAEKHLTMFDHIGYPYVRKYYREVTIEMPTYFNCDSCGKELNKTDRVFCEKHQVYVKCAECQYHADNDSQTIENFNEWLRT